MMSFKKTTKTQTKIERFFSQMVYMAMVTSIFALAVPVEAGAALDIDYICITSFKVFLDGIPSGPEPWLASFYAYVVDPGTLDHIDITKPGDVSPFATMYQDEEDHSRWDASQDDFPSSSLADLREDYPEGMYTFDFCEENGTVLRTVSLDYSGISEPGNPVNLTYPSDYGQTGIPTNPTITWTVNSSDGDALNMELGEATGTAFYRFGPASMDTTSWTPGPLLNGREYELDVSVINVKDLQSGPAFPTMTVDGDEFQYSLIIEYLNDIKFTTTIIDLVADTITPKTKWITCHILLPKGYDVADIKPDSILLEGTIPAIRTSVRRTQQMLVAKFPAAELNLEPSPEPRELTVSGELTDETLFEDSDFITVVEKGGGKK